MSAGTPWRGRLRRIRKRGTAARGVLFRGLFGDRLGLAVFLGCVCFTGLFWRIGVFINDNYTLVNTLVAVSEGRLYLTDPVVGSLESPGTYEFDGRAYGRNYGQIVFALPFLWALDRLSMIADVGVLLPALWCLTLLALAVQIGRLTGRERIGALVGSGLAVVLFFANVSVARPVSAADVPLLSLQVSALVATALVATTLYRLLARIHDRRLGVAGGVAAVVATPVGFWASLPKRHVYVAALVVGAVYAFYRSRHAQTDGGLSATGFRALAYVLVGATMWIHVAEGFTLLVALALVDLPTAPSNDPRTLALVGTAFALSLVPFLVTNVLISGHPFRPPRTLTGYSLTVDSAGDAATGGSTGGGWGSGADGSRSDGGSWSPVTGLLVAVVDVASFVSSRFFQQFATGLRTAVLDPGTISQVFVRSRYVEGVVADDNAESISLALAESLPAAGALVAVIPAFGLKARKAVADRRSPITISWPRLSPELATDALVVAVALLFTLIYLPRFPLHAQVTARYVLMLYPLVFYGLARLPVTRRAVGENTAFAVWSYAIGVSIGTQVLLAVVVGFDLGRGQAVQLHATVGLVTAGVLAITALTSAVDDRFDRLVAVALGVTAALGTAFVLLTGLSYFQYGQYALPVLETVSRYVSVV